MSSPCEPIIVWCPCGAVYHDSWRASINLSLDNFDDEYIERVSSTTCPGCGLKTRMGTLLARFENNHLRLDFQAIPKPLPVILRLHRPEREQPEMLQWIFDWVKQDPQPRVAQLQEIVSQKEEREPDHEGWYKELWVITRVFAE